MTYLLKILSGIVGKYKAVLLVIWLSILFSSAYFLYNFKSDAIEEELLGATNTEAYYSAEILEKEFKIKSGNSSAIVVDQKINTDEIIDKLKRKFNQLENVVEIKSPNYHRYKIIYIDFKAKYLFVESQTLTKDLRLFVKDFEKKYNSKIYVTGNASFYYDMKESGKDESSKGELFGLICSFMILIFNFGSLVSAFIPIVIGATTLIFTDTVIKLIGMEFNSISQVLSGLVGLALSIDYSLFMVSRFREEIKKENNHFEALKVSLSNSGKTIIVSALIMICSISVLLIPDVSSSRIVVKNLLVVVLVALFNSILFLPMILIYAKDILDRPKFISKMIKDRGSYARWQIFATHIVNYPKRYLFLSSVFLILIASPVIYMKLWEPSQTLAPQKSESMIGYNLLQKDNWGGELVPIEIVVKTKENVFSEKSISFIYNFTEFLKRNKNVASVQSITSWNSNFKKEDYYNLYGTLYYTGMINQVGQIFQLVNTDKSADTTLIKVFPKTLMDIEISHQIIKDAQTFAKDDNQVYIGGTVARARDFTKELYGYVGLMLTIILSSIYILLLFYMKSVILPIKAGIMNFLPIISSYGILTLIFQYGYFGNILSIHNNHAVTSMVPISLFCIIFGLSMDYEVLILSRISESYEETKNVKSAVVEGLAKSGSVITGAALILLAVFIPGIFSSSPGIKEISIGIISAILIDSTIVRLFLVPSFVVLMGKWNWWNPFKLNKEG